MTDNEVDNVTDDRLGAMFTGDGPVFVSDSEGRRVMLDDRQRERLATAVLGDDHLTTQEAADLLGVSRPTLVKLLDAGALPSTRPGAHRRVQAREVHAYLERERTRRRLVMEELGAQPYVTATDEGFRPTR